MENKKVLYEAKTIITDILYQRQQERINKNKMVIKVTERVPWMKCIKKWNIYECEVKS